MRKIKILFVAIGIACSSVFGSPSFGLSQRDCIVKRLESHVGVKEATGKNDGKEVEGFLKTCGLSKGHSWCGAFLNACFKSCGIATPKGAAWAPSWFPSDKVVFKASYISSGKFYIPPSPGDVIGIYNSRLKRIGHVGAVIMWERKNVRTIEGNTSGGGSREGDGVYYMIRPVWTISLVSNWLDKPANS